MFMKSFLVLTALVISFVLTHKAIAESGKINPGLLVKAQHSQSMRVIVSLNVAVQPEGRLNRQKDLNGSSLELSNFIADSTVVNMARDSKTTSTSQLQM
jgi:hypothetical protein